MKVGFVPKLRLEVLLNRHSAEGRLLVHGIGQLQMTSTALTVTQTLTVGA